ncbi:MAG: hypothetical protein WB819_04820, partial [Terriglobia bacterium]
DYERLLPYEYGFGVQADDPLEIDLAEPLELMRTLAAHGVAMMNLSCGSPYYTPHLQRPAMFPPIDGYLPPEDPLVGVWRQIDAVRQCKAALPTMPIVGTGYSYLQEYVVHVAQAVVREGGPHRLCHHAESHPRAAIGRSGCEGEAPGQGQGDGR